MATKTNLELISDGWFMEKNSQWPGQAMSLEVDEILESKKSEFQDVLIFKRYIHIYKRYCRSQLMCLVIISLEQLELFHHFVFDRINKKI